MSIVVDKQKTRQIAIQKKLWHNVLHGGRELFKKNGGAGGRVYRWSVVSRGYWAVDSRPSCGKRGLIMRATGEKAFEGRGHDPGM